MHMVQAAVAPLLAEWRGCRHSLGRACSGVYEDIDMWLPSSLLPQEGNGSGINVTTKRDREKMERKGTREC